MYAKLFVGNLSWNVNDADLEALFRSHASVQSAQVITDRETGRSRGFGFVELEADDINAVISAVNGQDVDGRPLRVNVAEDKGDRPRRGAGRDGGGYRGGRDRY